MYETILIRISLNDGCNVFSTSHNTYCFILYNCLFYESVIAKNSGNVVYIESIRLCMKH